MPQVNVIETKLGRIRVEGKRWFDDQQYIGAIRTRPGDPIDTASLAADTDWINRVEHRQATIAVEPTDDPSTYDLTLQAKDSPPLDLTLAADNTGTEEAGLYRVGIAVDWSNALWRGDDLNYSFLTSPDRLRLLEHRLTYTAYLPWRRLGDDVGRQRRHQGTGERIAGRFHRGRTRRQRFIPLQYIAACVAQLHPAPRFAVRFQGYRQQHPVRQQSGFSNNFEARPVHYHLKCSA